MIEENNNNNDCSINEEILLVVEMVATFEIDGYWFLHKHQYLYVSSEMRECEPRFVIDKPFCFHHLVYIPELDKEIAIPEHIGILTKELKTLQQQDTLFHLEQLYSDQIKERWEAYKALLPIGETDETRGNVVHRFGWYKEYLKKKLEG